MRKFAPICRLHGMALRSLARPGPARQCRQRRLGAGRPFHRASMLKVLSGDPSATFNIDGQHFERYVDRRASVALSSTARRLWLRSRHRTRRSAHIIAYIAPNGRLPASSPIDQSIEAALGVIKGEYTENSRLMKFLIARSHELEFQTVVDATHKDAYADLSQTILWKEEYRLPSPDLLALPGVKEMSVRAIGPGIDVSNNVVDACLALGLMNIELYLAKQFDCASTATGSPIDDCISLKLPRLTGNRSVHRKLWNFLDLAGVPDISGPLLADSEEMAKFLKLTRRCDAEAFRLIFNS
jgi:hypothetical protein